MEQNRPRIVVVGSSNMDLVVKSERIPAVGETILGGDFMMTPGGKGANQAVAAAKLGAEVYFVAKLGDDIFSEQSLANFEKEGVNHTSLKSTPERFSFSRLLTIVFPSIQGAPNSSKGFVVPRPSEMFVPSRSTWPG